MKRRLLEHKIRRSKMINNSRESVLAILDLKDITLPAALERCFKIREHSEKERAYITNISYQIYRYKLRFEAIIRLYCHKADGITENAQDILLMALCEMYCMNSIPLHASINEATQLAKKYAKTEVALINAVLRKTDKVFPNKELNKEKFMKEIKFLYPKKTLLEQEACYESLPSFVLDILRKQYGKEFCENYLKKLNEIPWYSYRFNPKKANWQECREDFEKESELSALVAYSGIASAQGNKLAKDYHAEGLLSMQGVSSQLVVQKIADFFKEKNIKIWDCCAGVGGKSLALAELGFDIVLASDTNKFRINLFEEERKRLGLKEIESKCADMRELCPKNIDCIVLDAPCSGIGTLGANPDLRYKISKKGILEVVELQKELFTKALSCIEKEKYICYITCSLNKKENEELVASCLEQSSAQVLLSEYIEPQAQNADYLYLSIIQKI